MTKIDARQSSPALIVRKDENNSNNEPSCRQSTRGDPLKDDGLPWIIVPPNSNFKP